MVSIQTQREIPDMKQRSYTADTPGLSALLLCDIVTQSGNVVNEEISKGY